MDERLEAITQWLSSEVAWPAFELTPASSDASFRRYFRVRSSRGSHIVMDAPPDREDCRPFVRIAEAFAAVGLNVPRILRADIDRGFLLLSDLGSVLYLDQLSDETADRLYKDALVALGTLQRGPVGDVQLPDYDRTRLWDEMCLFRDWFLARQLGLVVSGSRNAVLEQTFEFLTAAALEQPRVWVHRDYHSRNLLVTTAGNPGILDFQDAVVGPITYDLVSLLRDCYIAWPRKKVVCWATDYFESLGLRHRGRPVGTGEFLRWFDLMGIQRHLKAIGIFARLNLRDSKAAYLADIPRTLDYVRTVSQGYPELLELTELIDDDVLAHMEEPTCRR